MLVFTVMSDVEIRGVLVRERMRMTMIDTTTAGATITKDLRGGVTVGMRTVVECHWHLLLPGLPTVVVDRVVIANAVPTKASSSSKGIMTLIS